MLTWACMNKPIKITLISINFPHIFPGHYLTIYCPQSKTLCLVTSPQFIILCVKRYYKLLSLMASSDLHFSFWRVPRTCKNIKSICMPFSCLSVSCHFNSQAQPQNLGGQKKVFLPLQNSSSRGATQHLLEVLEDLPVSMSSQGEQVCDSWRWWACASPRCRAHSQGICLGL